MIEIRTHSEKETLNIGRIIGKMLTGDDIVCLSGELGSGKTVIAKGIALSLGIDEIITSPTFTIVNEYNSKIPLFHFDVYRISNSEEMFEIGFEEYLTNFGVVVIEWADIISDILPVEKIKILIESIEKNDDYRKIQIDFIGEKYIELEKKFENMLKGKTNENLGN